MLYHTYDKGKRGWAKEREGKRNTTTMTILGYVLFEVKKKFFFLIHCMVEAMACISFLMRSDMLYNYYKIQE